MWILLALSLIALVLAAVAIALALLSLRRLTLDTGWGRRLRPLGPQVIRIGPPREIVFDLVRVPYLSATPPRELREKVQVIDRGGNLVLAAHRTTVGRFTPTTVESVSLDRPGRVSFRLVRGPVPFVRETFVLVGLDDGAATELTYSGEMGTDGRALGALWGRIVAGYWEATVTRSLAALATAAETKTARRRARDQPT